MRPHISYSEWMCFRNVCQWRWKLDYLEGKRKLNYGIHLDFGTSIHAAIEKYKTRKDAVSLEEAIKIFEDTLKDLWNKNNDKYESKDREVKLDDFLSSGKVILERFGECKELADAEVLYNEHELIVPITRTDGVTINFKGYIDMVIKTKDKRGNTILYVCDFKSCSWGWPLEKKQDRDLQFQLFLYKHFLCKKFDLDPKLVRTAFVLLKKKPRKGDSPVEFLPVSAGPISVQRALDELGSDLTEIHVRIQDGKFVKNLNECTNKYGQTCPYHNTPDCPK